MLLAAGRGQRYRQASGQPDADKLLQPLADGTPVAVQAARHLRQALPAAPAVAVVRPDAPVLAAMLRAQGWTVVSDPAVAAGMGRSLALAVQASRGQAAAQAGGWLVALGDMPFIAPQTIRAVADVLAHALADALAHVPAHAPADLAAHALPGPPRALAAPLHGGRRGHPVAFSPAVGPELAALDGDDGARGLLQRHAQALVTVPVDDPGVLADVDEPADLRPPPPGRPMA